MSAFQEDVITVRITNPRCKLVGGMERQRGKAGCPCSTDCSGSPVNISSRAEYHSGH